MIEELEKKLDSFDLDERKQALSALCQQVEAGQINLPQSGRYINLHCHTFFSYNSYGYSPTKFAWLARKAGLAVAGIVDFDVLDGLDEFLQAARMLSMKACVGLETRVFVPEFADKVINSPGEPGISYHMGIGFPRARLTGKQQQFFLKLRKTAQKRNRLLCERVNKYLKPVELDYERDVLVLTPSGNPTERHICLAFSRRAKKLFADDKKLARFWSEKLGLDASSLELPGGQSLLNVIRAKTMKQGTAGYVQPDAGDFPKMQETNSFILAAGAIPTLTWLDGTSDGEKEIEKLLEVATKTGVAAINIIPDRNYTPNVKDKKLANLYSIVQLAEKMHLPVVVGTEMNSPGQKFVDDFDSQQLSPLLPVFLKGAYIVYAHSVLQQTAGLGYTGNWAKNNFQSPAEKNEFFHKLGGLIQPQNQDILTDLTEGATPQQILDKITG
jgi:hypothetical protein